MENPSLRVSGYGSSMNRTFIVENCAEDDFGQWATDEVTGEQGYIDNERSCFWTWDDNEYAWQSRPLKGRQVKRRNGKGKADPRGPEEHSLAKNKHKILNVRHKRTLLGGPKERKARKAGQKATKAFGRVAFVLTSQITVQARTTPRTKTKERTKNEKVRKEFILDLDFQPLKHPMKKDMAMFGNRTTGLPAIGLTIP